jgi:hypothetical protein
LANLSPAKWPMSETRQTRGKFQPNSGPRR